MTDFQRGIIALVKSAITERPIKIKYEFDWEKVYAFAEKHQIIPLVYYGIISSKADISGEYLSKFENGTYSCVYKNANQMYELQALCEAFSENGIDYMLLKGAVLQNMYQISGMRQMADVDILIKTSQYHVIESLMQELGYTLKVESNHEFVWVKEGALVVELHKMLIPSYNKDYYAYYGDGWQLAKQTDSCEYLLSDEDNFIYLLTHFAKHYRDGGIGIRHIVDFYVFLSNKPNISYTYIESELKRLQLLDFYKNVIKTVNVWFKDEKPTEVSDLITERIFISGAYGNAENHVLGDSVKKLKTAGTARGVRNSRFKNLIFLPYKAMCEKYKILKKAPILLPIMWIYRIFDVVIFKPTAIKRERNNLKLMTDENIAAYQQHLEAVGLDFNFKQSI